MLKKNQSITLEKDSYTLIKRISESEQSVIWQVTATSTGNSCVLKTIGRFDKQTFDVLNQQIQEEIDFLRAVQTNKTPCFITHCLDHGIINHAGIDVPAMIMPYYPKDLQQHIPHNMEQRPEYNLVTLVNWLTQLSQALCCTHKQIINGNTYIHHDIKPSHILLTENDEVRLIDFGIDKQPNDERGTTSIAHSPVWAAPEQFLPTHIDDNGDNIFRLTEKTDLYSLGLVAYYLYTGGGKPKTQTEFTHYNRNQAIYNQHILALKSGKEGQLGKVGGLSRKDSAYLHRRLFTLFFVHPEGHSTPMQTKDSLPLPHVVTKQILTLTKQLLLPRADERPSAKIVTKKLQRLQECLSPRLDNFTVITEKSDLQLGETLELSLQLNGQGLTAPFDWLQVYDQTQQPLPFKVLSVTPENPIFLAEENTVRLRLAPFEMAGDYQLSIIAAVDDKIHTIETDCRVQASADQLWKMGQHEDALKKDLRDEWLDALKKKSLSSVKARQDHLHLLTTLKESATDDKQKARLETRYQNATVIKKPLWQKGLLMVVGIGLLAGLLFKTIGNTTKPEVEADTTLSASENNTEAVSAKRDIKPAPLETETTPTSDNSVEVTQQDVEITPTSESNEEVTQQDTETTPTGEGNEEVTQQGTETTPTSEDNEEVTQQEDAETTPTSEDNEEVTQQEDAETTPASEDNEEVAQQDAETTSTSENSEEVPQQDTETTSARTRNEETTQQATKTTPVSNNIQKVSQKETKTDNKKEVTQQQTEVAPNNADDFTQNEVNAIQGLLNQ